MSQSLGEAFFEVLADTSQFGSGLEEQIGAAVGDVQTTVSSAMDDVSADIEGALSDVGAGAFDGLGDEADSAASEVSDAFDGVADEIEASLSGISMEGLGDTVRDNMLGITAASVGGAAAAEGFARSQQDSNLAFDRMGRVTGDGEQSMRDMALAMQNATFPMEDVTSLMETATQRGLEGDAIGEFAGFWDMVGDATGEAGPELGKASTALQLVGIEAGNEAEALDALGFITDNTTGSVAEFLRFTERAGKELGDNTPSVDEMAAALAGLEDKGFSSQIAQRELQQALRESDGDMNAALDTLGISQEEFAALTGQVEGSGVAITSNAAAFAESRTVMQKMQAAIENVSTRFGGLSQIVGGAAGALGAAGPALLGITQAGPLMAKSLGGITKAFGVLKTAILANPMFLIAALVIGIIAVIWHFREEIMAALGAAWDWIRDTAGAVWEWLTDTVSGAVDRVVEFVGGLRDRIAEFFRAMWDFVVKYHPLAIAWRLAVEWVPKIIAAVVELAGQVVDTVADWVENVVGFVTDLWSRWVTLVHGIRDAVIEAVVNLVTSVVQAVSGWVESIVGFVTDLWRRWVTLVHGIRDAVIDAVTEFIGKVIRFVKDWISDFVALITGLKDSVVGVVSDLVDGVVDFFRDLPGRVVRVIGNLGSTLWSAGRDLIQGLIDGAGSLLSSLGRFFLDKLPGWIRTPFEKVFGISSPSTVFAGYGGDMIEGLTDGVRRNARDAMRTIEQFANEATAAGEMGALFQETGLGVVRRTPGTVRPAEIDPASDRGRAGDYSVVQHIYTLDPIKAARESIRELRDVAYLAAPLDSSRVGTGAGRETYRVR